MAIKAVQLSTYNTFQKASATTLPYEYKKKEPESFYNKVNIMKPITPSYIDSFECNNFLNFLMQQKTQVQVKCTILEK